VIPAIGSAPLPAGAIPGESRVTDSRKGRGNTAHRRPVSGESFPHKARKVTAVSISGIP